jgi:hypothetical protein
VGYSRNRNLQQGTQFRIAGQIRHAWARMSRIVGVPVSPCGVCLCSGEPKVGGIRCITQSRSLTYLLFFCLALFPSFCPFFCMFLYLPLSLSLHFSHAFFFLYFPVSFLFFIFLSCFSNSPSLLATSPRYCSVSEDQTLCWTPDSTVRCHPHTVQFPYVLIMCYLLIRMLLVYVYAYQLFHSIYFIIYF